MPFYSFIFLQPFRSPILRSRSSDDRECSS